MEILSGYLSGFSAAALFGQTARGCGLFANCELRIANCELRIIARIGTAGKKRAGPGESYPSRYRFLAPSRHAAAMMMATRVSPRSGNPDSSPTMAAMLLGVTMAASFGSSFSTIEPSSRDTRSVLRMANLSLVSYWWMTMLYAELIGARPLPPPICRGKGLAKRATCGRERSSSLHMSPVVGG